MTKTQRKPSLQEHDLLESVKELILYNDNVNLFDYVVESLIVVCDHEPCQAEQCALVAHHKGKCGIKGGTVIELAPVRDELSRRGLTVSID